VTIRVGNGLDEVSQIGGGLTTCGPVGILPDRISRGGADVINGGEGLRKWVDDAGVRPGDLDAEARKDEQAWRDEREAVLIYR